MLSLLALETKRIALGISQSERDDALFRNGFSLPLYDPRRLLGSRDSMIDEMKRAAVPSSFKGCSSGPSCRSHDRLTLSIARNRLCAQCFQRFCAKCMEESVLLEGRLAGESPVCFSCAGELEQAKQMLVALQRSNKFSDPPSESSEETACRHVLRLVASIVHAARLWQHYPFVRTLDCRANLMFVPERLVPLDFCWECSGPTELLVHLPFAAAVKSIEVILPASQDVLITFKGGESARVVASAALSGGARCKVKAEQTVFESVLRVQFSGKARVSRLLLELERETEMRQHANVPAMVSVEARGNNSFEIFGKKSSDGKSSGSNTTKITADLMQDMLTPLMQRILEPCKRDVRGGGNTVDFWLVKQRNSVEFAGGGFAIRLGREEQPQQVSVRAHSLCLDQKGDYVSHQLLGTFCIPSVACVSVVWFPLTLVHNTSCISLEVICVGGVSHSLLHHLFLTAAVRI